LKCEAISPCGIGSVIFYIAFVALHANGSFMADTCPVIRAKDALTLKMESAHRQRRVFAIMHKTECAFLCSISTFLFQKSDFWGYLSDFPDIFPSLFYIMIPFRKPYIF
jgi:hypothetical protein